MRTWLVVGALALTGCIEPNLRLCDDGQTACAIDMVCLPGGGCGSPADVTACAGLEDGAACTSDFGAGRCRGGACRTASCGNAVIEGGEVCDDGNLENGDGCNGTCTSMETCGNGISELLEACDCGDATHPGGALCGDTINGGTICRTDCTLVRCGNGATDVMEICDDGNVVSGDGCNSTCTSLETCGNNILDVNEQCDDGNTAGDDTCQPNCITPRCGDNWLDDGEVCDDGDNTPGDGCSFDCMSDETCGNGYVDFFADEQCDDNSNGLLHDGCTDTCLREPVIWSEATVAPNPGARHAHAMVYDSTRKTLIAFGGMTGSLVQGSSSGGGPQVTRVFSDTWEWDPLALHWNKHVAVGPSARFGHAMAYDATRKRVVVFGGYARQADSSLVALDDTWEWDSLSTKWTKIEPAAKPPARGFHSMSFDSARGRIVMFGGATATFGDGPCGGMPAPAFTDTWEWTGTNWDLRTPTGASPKARVSSGMVFDPASNRTLLLPGLRVYDGSSLDTVWEWQSLPGTWTARSNLGPDIYGYAVGFDAANKLVIAFGGERISTSGCGYDTAHDYTTTWNTVTDTWTSTMGNSSSPPERSFSAGAFVSATNAFTLFGGQDNGSSGSSGTNQVELADVWQRSGSAWTKSVPPVPPTLHHASIAYDAARQQVVVYGGGRGAGTGEQSASETWIWDGYTWSRRFPANTPGGRQATAMAYDAKRERIVLFGGGQTTGSSVYADDQTWEWDGTNWLRRTDLATNPPQRAGHQMAYDAERRQIVMFGGSQYYSTTGGIYTPSNETWLYDGNNWTSPDTALVTKPPGRVQAAMAYDPVRKVIVMFGGTESATSGGARVDLGDTWEWNGASWSLRAETGPVPRDRAVLVSDPLNLGIVMYGGAQDGELSDVASEIWQWDGVKAEWKALDVTGGPAGRYAHVGTYDGARHRIVFAFGIGEDGEHDDTWALATVLQGANAPIDDNCSGASDLDDDGLMGCADPDCWSYCTPACPVLTSCPTGAPYCGDNVCQQPRENAVRCPADCP